MLSMQTLTPRFSRYSRRRIAVVVLPEPLGPVRQTMGFCPLFIKMLAAAELIFDRDKAVTGWLTGVEQAEEAMQ